MITFITQLFDFDIDKGVKINNIAARFKPGLFVIGSETEK